MVKNALAALAHVNKQRTANPNFNNLVFDKVQKKEKSAKSIATPLDYKSSPDESSHLKYRDVKNTKTSGNKAYSIPDELARAAAIVAESTSNKPTGNHSKVASQIRNKYGKGQRDTNTPRQALVYSNGLSGYLSTGDSDDVVFGNQTARGTINKRDVSKYWMETIDQNGQSPFAPAGYKVFLSSFWS